MQGIELSRRFYGELVRPWLAGAFPALRHAAALMDFGSELLGFDDEMSQDHNWGPRVRLYVTEADFAAHADAVIAAFTAFAPATFQGVPIGLYNRPHPAAHGHGARSDIRHGLEVHTLEATLQWQLGLTLDEPRDNLTWLGLAEQRLLTFTSGGLFHDDDGRLTQLRARLSAYPRDVLLYKLAGQWRRNAEEQAFVGRTGLGGDELGSRVIAARLARDLMRLAFLVEGRYAPYPKWFGKGFAALPCANEIAPLLDRVLDAADWKARETALAEAYLALALLHKARDLPGYFEPRIGPFWGRPFTVINAEEIIAAISAEIPDPALRALPVIGGLDQVTDSTPVVAAPARARRAMAGLLHDPETSPVEEA